MRQHVISLAVLLALSGCARSPVFNVLGSYFPGWIACLLLGLMAAALAHSLLKKLNWEARVSGLPLFYVSLVLAIACVIWLIAFE